MTALMIMVATVALAALGRTESQRALGALALLIGGLIPAILT
jgi:hypothetical protein